MLSYKHLSYTEYKTLEFMIFLNLKDILTKGFRGSRKFCRGSTIDVFLVDEGWEDPNTTISGSSSALPAKGHLNGMAFR